MTERLTCSNCGGPVTRTGDETHVTCPHCGQATDIPAPSPVAAPLPVNAGGSGYGGGDIPAIVIIQSAPTVFQENLTHGVPRPVVVRTPSILRYIFVPIVFVVIATAITTFVRLRAAHVTQSIEAAEKAVEKAEKAADRKHR
jgi:hypothetical protein